jgi:hypothetical protein
MYTADDVFDDTRPMLVRLIEQERKMCGSAVQAVATVARKIGASSAWVQRVTGRYGSVSLHAHHYLNIKDAYDRLCERIEAAAEREKNITLALEGAAAHASVTVDFRVSAVAPPKGPSRPAFRS